ncbi:Beta-lactamase-related protein [Macrophomina phaseolina MS6]|uniref:Beta-lactamase-related protein n=1 Tax=Macrophomina phaseolina (strain MS6) TaxID=1126212 RepID=K2SI33_MACPH|nr:Beta-lactamase-related protein [Macrophomina phaseolina MS6]
MESLDQIAQGFLKDEQLPLPRVTIGAVNKSGSFNYLKSFGEEAGGPEGEPSDVNALHWVASCTKLITTIAALQCVEKGLLALDDDVAKLLPEWKDAKILLGHDDNKQPIFKPAENTITLRQLLTHTAGMAYRFSHPLVEEYFANRGEGRLLLAAISESYPPFLVSEPGTEWCYSPGLDWAGQMVRISPQAAPDTAAAR